MVQFNTMRHCIKRKGIKRPFGAGRDKDEAGERTGEAAAQTARRHKIRTVTLKIAELCSIVQLANTPEVRLSRRVLALGLDLHFPRSIKKMSALLTQPGTRRWRNKKTPVMNRPTDILLSLFALDPQECAPAFGAE
jgi:hypothetical protein